MPFFEPGKFEEFVIRLSSIRVRPPGEVWSKIDAHLDATLKMYRRQSIIRLVAAACVSLLVVTSLSYYVSYNFAHIAQELPREPLMNFTESTPFLPPSNPRILAASSKPSTPFTASIKEPETIRDNHIPIQVQNLNARAEVIPVGSNPSTQLIPTRLSPRDAMSFSSSIESSIDDIPEAPRAKSGWKLTFAAYPSFSHNTLGALGANNLHDEMGVWLWGGGVTAQRITPRRSSVSVGVQISPLGQQVNNLILVRTKQGSTAMKGIEANTTYGQVSLDSRTTGITDYTNLRRVSVLSASESEVIPGRLRQTFYYLEVPVMLTRTFSNEYFSFDLKLGASGSVLLRNNFVMDSNLGIFTGTTQGVKPFAFSALAAVSVSYPIAQNLSLVLEPNFRLVLQPLRTGSSISFPFAFSTRFGIGYNF